MVDRIEMHEGLASIFLTSGIVPVKGRNGNLQDRHFHREFQEEEEENKKKRRREHDFRPTEIVKVEKSGQGIVGQRDSHEHQEHTKKVPYDTGQQRRIDVIV
jgi:hypothetical protein